MSDVDLVAWHEELPPPRFTQMSLGASRGRDGAPVLTQQRRVVVDVAAATPAPQRSFWRVLLARVRRA